MEDFRGVGRRRVKQRGIVLVDPNGERFGGFTRTILGRQWLKAKRYRGWRRTAATAILGAELVIIAAICALALLAI
jgi:hypothetical protein